MKLPFINDGIFEPHKSPGKREEFSYIITRYIISWWGLKFTRFVYSGHLDNQTMSIAWLHLENL